MNTPLGRNNRNDGGSPFSRGSRVRMAGRRHGIALVVVAICTVAASVVTAQSQTTRVTTPPERLAFFGATQHGTPACASCHGMLGEGEKVQYAPRLAGLDADYLQRQLDAFADGSRRSNRMNAIARTLSDDERAAVAQYYASRPLVVETVAAVQPSPRGAALAVDGDWSHQIPPCKSCHGGDGLGVGSVAPPLAGQRVDYIASELANFKRGDRRSDPLGLMRDIAGRLDQKQIDAVARYYASLPVPGAKHGGFRE